MYPSFAGNDILSLRKLRHHFILSHKNPCNRAKTPPCALLGLLPRVSAVGATGLFGSILRPGTHGETSQAVTGAFLVTKRAVTHFSKKQKKAWAVTAA